MFDEFGNSEVERDEVLAHPVFNRMDEEVKASLTLEQASEFLRLIPQVTRKHRVDIRGVIPFRRVYFVVLMGADKGRKNQNIVQDARSSMSCFKNVFSNLLFLGFPLLFFAMIYLIINK